MSSALVQDPLRPSGTGGYWGLVQQKGPWKSTAADVARSILGDKAPHLGGGLGVGGTKHAGAAYYMSYTNPTSLSGRFPVPRPGVYRQDMVVAALPLAMRLASQPPGRMPAPLTHARQEVSQRLQDEVQYPRHPDNDPMRLMAGGVDRDGDEYEEREAGAEYEEYEDDDDEDEEDGDGLVRYLPIEEPQHSIYDLSKLPLESLLGHTVGGVADFAMGNFIGTGAHIGGALGDLVKPTGLVPETVDTMAISNLVSLGGMAASSIESNLSKITENLKGVGDNVRNAVVRKRPERSRGMDALYRRKYTREPDSIQMQELESRMIKQEGREIRVPDLMMEDIGELEAQPRKRVRIGLHRK